MTDPAHVVSRPRRRPAFTFVELLVVMGMISLLIVMLLPAVQRCREAARRASCQNNLMQIGLAIHNYEMAHQVLPPGSVNPTGPVRSEPAGYHASWITQILPHLEESALYRMIDRSEGVYHPSNSEARSTAISILVCPSVGVGMFGRGVNGEVPAPNSYAGCYNDTETPIDVDNNGVMYLNSRVALRDISDGTTYTALVGEKLYHVTTLGWVSGTRATLRNLSVLDTSRTLSNYSDPVADQMETDADKLIVGGFGSVHGGAIQFVSCDGSLRLISSTADAESLQRFGNRHDGQLVRDLGY